MFIRKGGQLVTVLAAMIFVSLFHASSAMAVEAPPGPGGITKVCPPTDWAGPLKNLIGSVWGYVEVIAPLIATGAFLLLVVVAAIPRLRAKVSSWFYLPVGLLLVVGLVFGIITYLPGRTCV